MLSDFRGTYNGLSDIGGSNYNQTQEALFEIYPNDEQDYCTYTLSLLKHFQSGGTHQNVPKTLANLVSVPETNNASWRTIASGTSATYAAHNSILIQPGFTAQAGSTFTAKILPCLDCESRSKSILFLNNNDDIIEKNYATYSESFKTEQFLQDNTINKEINLYPNPNSGTFQLETNFPLSDIGNLKITNLMGATVFETQSISSNTIQLQNSASGTYFVVMILKDGSMLTQKMVVQ